MEKKRRRRQCIKSKIELGGCHIGTRCKGVINKQKSNLDASKDRLFFFIRGFMFRGSNFGAGGVATSICRASERRPNASFSVDLWLIFAPIIKCGIEYSTRALTLEARSSPSDDF